jgi:hypothetical protein
MFLVMLTPVSLEMGLGVPLVLKKYLEIYVGEEHIIS